MRRAAIIVVALLIAGGGVVPLFVQGHATVPVNAYQSGTVACGSVWTAWTRGVRPLPGRLGAYEESQCNPDRRNKAIIAGALFGAGFLVFVFGLLFGGRGNVGASLRYWFGTGTPPGSPRPRNVPNRPPPPPDQRPPPGWWWDGDKWNPPAP
jgi:hypothetical protein